MKIGLIFLIAAVVVISGCIQNIDNESSSTTPTTGKVAIIEITSSGFNPSTVNIKSGDTVAFVNKDTARHWPASDDHPIHTNLPGFDAKKGLNQGESYSFTFTESGSWGFHDHLNPSLTGIVSVS